MPNLPDTNGLPVWAQILVSILVCIGTLGVAFSGYFKKTPLPDASPAAPQIGLAALLSDHGAIRHNSDALLQLSVNLIALTKTIEDATHYNRNEVDLLRTMCERLSDLKDEIERQGRDNRERDDRDEGRRDRGRRID